MNLIEKIGVVDPTDQDLTGQVDSLQSPDLQPHEEAKDNYETSLQDRQSAYEFMKDFFDQDFFKFKGKHKEYRMKFS